MKRLKFLNKLYKERKVELIEPSDEVKESYLEKASNCLQSARILLPHKLYENVIIDAYYTMYDALLALLFKVGIKSENHLASIIFLEELFKEKELAKIILESKDERIDKQSYVKTEKTKEITKEAVEHFIVKAEAFLVKIKIVIEKLTNNDLSRIKSDFEDLCNVNSRKLTE